MGSWCHPLVHVLFGLLADICLCIIITLHWHFIPPSTLRNDRSAKSRTNVAILIIVQYEYRTCKHCYSTSTRYLDITYEIHH
jgi:hypothetical protein